MKRIEAAVNGSIKSDVNGRRIKRVFRSIEIAKDNALDAIEQLNNKRETLITRLKDPVDPCCFIQQLADVMGEIKDQEEIISRLDEIKAYLEEDVNVEG